MPIDTTALSVEDQSALLSAGLITPDNELTPLGTLSANLSDAGLDEATRAAAVRDFNKGYLNPDLSFTETGELHYMDKETAVHRGRDTFRAWYLQGGWERHKDSQPDNPFYKQVGDAVKALSTKTIPQAIEGAALAVGSATGIYKFFGQDDVQESVDATVGASSGMFLKEMARNTAMMSLGNNLVWAKGYTAATGDNEPEISALYDFERGMSELDQTTSADAAAALTALSHVVEPDDEKAEMAMLEAAQRTREGVELARQEVGNERLLQEYDERLASFGELAGGPELLAGGLASFVPRKVLTAGGRATAKRIASLNREIVEKTALRQTAENALKADNAAMILGRKTSVDRVALRKQVEDLSNQIDELAETAEKVANKSFARGGFGQLRDSVRDLGNKTGSAIAGSKIGSIGTKIDNYFTAPRGLPGHAKNIAAAGGVLAAAELGAKVLDAVNLPGAEVARFGSKALALGYLAPTLYGRAKTLARTTHAMGASYVARRSTVPYWRKVSQRMADNKLVSGAALTMDVFAKPLVPVANMGKAAGRAMVAELPFNFIASGGQEGWLAEAIAEGLVFSVPGQFQGLIHGMGGMPAVMRKAEFDQLAANDAAELRRYLPARHQQAFDSLDPSVRRIVGVYSAMFPDLEFRFQPAPGNTTGSGYDRNTDTVYIDPNSKRPFDALIAHEVAHGVQERGFDRLIIDKLVGQDGLLRNEDGSLTSDALKFKAEYEGILGRQIDDETLAREWFAESSVPGLMRTQQLQRLVRRNPITRSLAESLLPKIPFGKRILLRSGILLDQDGNPVAGQGSMQALTQASPAVAQIVDRYLRTVAGTSRPSDSRVAVEKAKARPLTREERENADRKNQIDFEQEADGSQKKENGRRVLIDNKTRRQRGAKLGQEIEKLAEEISFADPDRMPEKMSLVDKINLFNEEEWTKLIDRLEKAGIYNPSQLALFREVFKRKAIGNSESLLFDYQPAIKTKGSSKRYDSREAELITGAIYEIKVTKDKNVLLNIIDMDFLEQRAMKAAATKLGQELYPGGTAAIMRDVMILAENHVNGVPNATVFTKPNQLNFLNGILGNLSKEHQAKNPLAKGRPAVRSLRLDRINQAEGLQQKGLPFIPDKWRDNLLPEPADNTGKAMPEASKFDYLTGAPVPKNADGTITVYHRTNTDPAVIRKSGFVSKENTDEIFVSNRIDGEAQGYGDRVIELRIQEDDLVLDDAFTDEVHFRVPIQKANQSIAAVEPVDPDIRRMPEQLDADHRTAVEAGDMETAQELVRQAAVKAGFEPTVLFHGVRSRVPFTTFAGTQGPDGYGTYVTTDESYAHSFTGLQEGTPFSEPELKRLLPNQEMLRLYAKPGRIKIADGQDPDQFVAFTDQRTENRSLTDQGYDSEKLQFADGNYDLRLTNNDQLKSADPATYDDQGNLIPLSERFNPESDDIRRLPEPKATIEEFKGQNIQVLTSDMSIVQDIKRGNDVVAMQGGPAFLDNRGWGFTTQGAAEAFRERWRKSGEPLIGLTTLTPNNHLNSSEARRAYALKWRDAVAEGKISKTAANKHIRQAMLRIIRSDAKSSLVKTAKPTAKKIKTVDDLVEFFPQLPWGSSSVVYDKLAGRTLPIKPEKLEEVGLDLETVADELRQPEFQGAGLGDLFAIARYDGSDPQYRPDLNTAYPYFIAMPKRAVLKDLVSVANLTTDARVFQKKDLQSGKLSAQPLMTTGVMLDQVTRGVFPSEKDRKRIKMDPETPVTPSDPAEQIIN